MILAVLLLAVAWGWWMTRLMGFNLLGLILSGAGGYLIGYWLPVIFG
jgi:hypothetical protein